MYLGVAKQKIIFSNDDWSAVNNFADVEIKILGLPRLYK